MHALSSRPSNREWFNDRRSADRRLQVTWHDDERTAVVSIWHLDTCAATFQLPVDETARLIGHLADGLASAARETIPPAPTRDSWSSRLRRWTRRASADIVPLRRR